MKKCDLCGVEFDEWGNNPMPIKDGVCCDWCNGHLVIPLRFRILQLRMKNKNSKIKSGRIKK